MPLVGTGESARDVPYDRLAMLELSANLYGSWGVSWCDAIQLPQHIDMLNLFLFTVDCAINANVETYLETVVDSRDKTRAHSFRLWIPLAGDATARFVTAVAAKMPVYDVVVEDAPTYYKKPRVERNTFTSARMNTKRTILEALRIYKGAHDLADVVATPVAGGECIGETHILTILDGRAQLERCQRAYLACCVADEQRFGDGYMASADHGRTWRFGVPPAVSAAGLVRVLRPTDLTAGDDLLGYHLPHLAPAAHQLEAALASVKHATGVDDVVGSADPCCYSNIHIEAEHDAGPAIEGLLKTIYPVMERVKRATRRRLDNAANADTYNSVVASSVRELETLYSLEVSGVPTVYSQLRKESRAGILAMRATDAPDRTLYLARSIFWRKQSDSLTPFGNLMSSLIAGVCSASRLLPSQRKLWLLLFCRAHKVVHNCVGANAYIIIAGPSEVGKSKVCLDVMECMPKAIAHTNDGRSAKAYTAVDLDADMRVMYEDELQKLAGTNDENTKAQQTLISNGIIKTQRLVRTNDGEFVLRETLKAGRVLTFTCTNTLGVVADAVKSRALIVAVAATKMPGPSAATLAAVGAPKDNSRAAFVRFCQTLCATQVEFWSLEAGGLITIDDSMILLYAVVAAASPGVREVSARAMGGIRDLAIAMMVMDLESRWHRLGVGASYGWSNAAQATWFAKNAVVKMEHVVASVAVLTKTTSVRHEMNAIETSLRALVRQDPFNVPVVSPDGAYYVLATNRRRFDDEVANANLALGPGLAKSLLRAVVQGITDGRPNIKFDIVEREEVVYLNRAFAATTETAADLAIFDALKSIQAGPSAPMVSWCGKYFVYPQSVRCAFADSSDSGARSKYASLRGVPQGVYKLALSILADKTIAGGKVWTEAQTCPVRVPVDPATANPLACVLDGAHYLKRNVPVPLLVHRRAFEAGANARVVHDAQQAVFATCLAIAGGYESKKAVLGIGHSERGVATVAAAETAHVAVANPLYLNTADVDMLFGDVTDDVHPIFPSTAKTLTFTEASNAEALCFARCAKW